MGPIDLRTNDERYLLRLENIEKFSNESFRCLLQIRSGDFSFQRPFYFDDSHLPDFIDGLSQMNNGCVLASTLKARWEDDFITFRTDKLGHVFVTGQVYERAEIDQSMEFGFRTDQTVLEPLIGDLKELMKAK